MRRGPLIQLGSVGVDPGSSIGAFGLEEDLPGLGRPVVDVLEVQPGVMLGRTGSRGAGCA